MDGEKFEYIVLAKALANYMFREIIEDAHVEYKISQADMKKMNKQAVNRAALFFEILQDDDLWEAFPIYSTGTNGWDDPECTEEIKKIMDCLHSLSHKVR